MLAPFYYIWINVFVWLHDGDMRTVKQKLSIISNLSSAWHTNYIALFWCMVKKWYRTAERKGSKTWNSNFIRVKRHQMSCGVHTLCYTVIPTNHTHPNQFTQWLCSPENPSLSSPLQPWHEYMSVFMCAVKRRRWVKWPCCILLGL